MVGTALVLDVVETLMASGGTVFYEPSGDPSDPRLSVDRVEIPTVAFAALMTRLRNLDQLVGCDVRPSPVWLETKRAVYEWDGVRVVLVSGLSGL